METFKNKFKSISSFTLIVSALLFFIRCTNGRDQQMSGAYVNSAGSEASTANDTLLVGLDHGQQYKIFRSTGFRLIDNNGKQGELQYETEIWTASYDPATQVMTENRNGKVITFDGVAETMTVGKRRYKRIKND